jgi:atlastin
VIAIFSRLSISFQFATEYANFSTLSNKKNIPFQHLIFLIRDWQNKAERPFGWLGGLRYLNETVLETRENHDKASHELREYLREKSFQKINCFLMPHPGLEVTEIDFDGRLASVRDDFKEQLKLLVPEILHPEKLICKGLYMNKMKASSFNASIASFVELFKSERLPEPKSFFETMVENQLKGLFESCLHLYLTEIDQVKLDIKNQNEIALQHEICKNKALQHFLNEPKMGTKEDQDEYRNDLAKQLNQEYDKWKDGIRERLEKEDVELKMKQKKEKKRCRFDLCCFRLFSCRKW